MQVELGHLDRISKELDALRAQLANGFDNAYSAEVTLKRIADYQNQYSTHHYCLNVLARIK